MHQIQQAVTTPLYECQFCGAASIVVSDPLTTDAVVQCGGCGSHVATWKDFQILVERIILDGRTLRYPPEVWPIADPLPGRTAMALV